MKLPERQRVDEARKEPPGFRWLYENALEKSDLPPMTCWLLSRIAARADPKTGVIPVKFMPSEASLAAATHMSPRSVRDHLHKAGIAGWLEIRHREGKKSEYGNVFWPHGDNFIWLHSSQR